MSSILNLISLSKKAGELEAGEEPTMAAARSHQAKLIIVARDASENTYRRVRHLGEGGNVIWVSVPYTKAELGHAIGRGETAMAAVMDTGFAVSMIRGLAQDDPEKYEIPLRKLTEKHEKAQRRLQEKRQHEKNLKTGKYYAKLSAHESKHSGNSNNNPSEKQKEKSASTWKKSKANGFSGQKRTKAYRSGKSGRSNRYEECGPTGKPGAGKQKSHES